VPVLDTDVLTIIQRRSEPGYSRLISRLRSLPPRTPVWVTIVSLEEQLRGWLEYIKRAKSAELPQRYDKLLELQEDFRGRPLLSFDDDAVRVYETLLRAKTRVATMDLRIASIVIAHDEVLISANLRDFRRIPKLRVEDWSH
jgi:tRNA(fMet)-specific endonuclease VapC